MSFFQKGIGDIDAAASVAEKSANGGQNTGKFLIPGKNNPELRVVPLVDLDSSFPNDDLVVGYMEYILYWDATDLEEKKKTNPELEGLRSIFSWPKISSDPEIDPGTWLMANTDVFKNAKVKTSTMYKRSLDKPMDLKKVYLTAVLWLNKPPSTDGNNDEEDNSVRVLKTTQKSIEGGLKDVYELATTIKGMAINIKLAADGKSYAVVCIGPAKQDLPTELGLKIEDYVGFRTRQAIVDTLAQYGVTVPPVPENKKAELAAIENMIAAATSGK